MEYVWPTEATIWCSLKKIQANQPITIGKPIHNMEMRVLDASHHILPPYVKGELYISGLGLAQGYFNNESLTKERFIPCKDALGGRLYRVGDIACATPEGEFLIFGRTDNQVKLHGYRIELEDIESHIQQIPSIRDCVVLVYQEQLIAYLCLFRQETYSEKALMAHLTADLPEYMIPQRIIILEQFPLTIGGKVDRNALPPPLKPPLNTITNLCDLTPTELSLRTIWAEELHLTCVGVHDHFIELGGHSLLAARITNRILERFEKQITLKAFYHAPNIAALATIVEAAPKVEKLINTELISTTESNDPWLPLNDFQLTLWIASIFEPKLRKFNVVDRKRLQGPLSRAGLDKALRLVFQKHEILSYQINRFYPLQRPRKKQSLQWIETSLVEYDDLTCETLLSGSFDVLYYDQTWRSNAPLIIAKLFYLKHDQIELQICMSHLISDENSLAIFFQELSNAYLFYTKHTPLHTSSTSQPFRSYALNQMNTSKRLSEQDVSFWKSYMKDAGLFNFPQKQVVRGIKNQQGSFSTYLEIPEVLFNKLRHICIQNFLTISDVLCAAIGLSLRVICDENNITLPHKLFMNTVKSTRSDPNYDHVLGCFLAVHPIKLDLNEATTLVNLAKKAQQSTLETIEHQRASSLIKLASVGQLSSQKSPFKTLLISLAMTIVSKISKGVHLDASILTAFTKLAVIERKNSFLINVNILNSFIKETSHNASKPLFGLQTKPIPFHAYNISLVEHMFDVCFLWDKSLNKPFMVISSNLTPDFKAHFGSVFLEILQKEPLKDIG